MRIAVASDHAGFNLKATVIDHLQRAGHDVIDLGVDHVDPPSDYPLFCSDCARAVVAGRADLGVVIGGSGQGEQIAANKVHGARAALCHDDFTARLARQHNDANVLSLGARVLGEELALEVVDTFLGATFEGGRHQRRIDQIADIEHQECEGA